MLRQLMRFPQHNSSCQVYNSDGRNVVIEYQLVRITNQAYPAASEAA